MQQKKEIFFPTNFNSVLDYFKIKGKERIKMNKIDDALNKMKDYVEKQKNDRRTDDEKLFSNRDFSEQAIYDLKMEDIMEMFADLLTPKRIMDDNQQSIKGQDRKEISNIIRKPVNIEDFNHLFPDKDKNYISNYLRKEHKVNYSFN